MNRHEEREKGSIQDLQRQITEGNASIARIAEGILDHQVTLKELMTVVQAQHQTLKECQVAMAQQGAQINELLASRLIPCLCLRSCHCVRILSDNWSEGSCLKSQRIHRH